MATPQRPPIRSNTSAKKLINRYEQLSSLINATPPKVPPRKDKSPLQSFRNLLAVIKKGSGFRTTKSNLQECSPSPDIVEKLVKLPPIPPVMTAPSMKPSPQSFSGPNIPSSIFYLSRHSNPKAGWTPCSAVLQGDYIHLTWPNNSSSHSIALRGCIDVRSTTSEELDEEEKTLLSTEIQGLNMFQMQFEGRCVEKFATSSVRERACWITAIWDVILPSGSATEASSHSTDTDVSRRSTASSFRALPPLPQASLSPTRLAPMAVTSPGSIYPPSSPASSRVKSPSIANLSQLSVVKNRLAQIEPSQQSQSRSLPNSPYDSQPVQTRPLRIEIPTPRVAKSAVSPTSILEAYVERSALPSSPADYFSIPPGETSANQFAPRDEVILQAILQNVSNLAQQFVDTKNGLSRIQNQMDKPPTVAPELKTVDRTLNGIQQKLRTDIPYVLKSLADIQAFQHGPQTKEDIRQLIEPPMRNLIEKFDELRTILEQDASHRNEQDQRQIDNTRYLNQLNSWLESFVTGSTAQVGIVAANVDKMCRELGCTETGGRQTGLIGELRTLVSSMGQTREDLVALEQSVNNLATMVTSQARDGLAPKTFANLIEKQRQDFEGLLRAHASELTCGMKNEQLRFVDAMQKATKLDLTMQVQDLKNQLNHGIRADLSHHYAQAPQHAPARAPGCAPGQIYHHPQLQQPQPRMMPQANARPMPGLAPRYGDFIH